MAGYVGKYKGAFKKGDSGKDCAAVKRCLKRIQHNNSIKASRTFGKAADQALKLFQKRHDLHPDGIYGPRTHRKLAPLMRGYEVYLYKRAAIRQSALSTWVVVAPNANRPGVGMKPGVETFVSKAAHVYGGPVIITCGTNHNRYVLGTNRESQHWKGYGGDVGFFGSQLTKFGQAALVAAGMPKWRAKLCRGGVYNVGGYNILFNTMVGGNHWNHCHIGIPE
jgi:Putative peptidoglycan binding domain